METAATEAVTEPIESELWELTRRAVWASGAAADEYLASGGWRPRVTLPSVSSFDSGWPNLHRSRVLTPDDAPTDFSSLFGVTSGQLKPIAFSDVPELEALFDFVRSRSDLRSRVWMTSATRNDEIEERFFAYEVSELALSLLDRARATGAATDEDLLPLYVQRERAWLLDPLPVEYLFPLTLTALELDSTLTLDDSTRIEPLDPPTQAARAPDDYSVWSVSNALIGAATHALVVDGAPLSNPGPTPRLVDRNAESPPLDQADLACEALRIATHVDVGYAQVLRRPLGWADRWTHALPPLTTVTVVRRYPESFDEYGWLRKPNPIPADRLHQLPALFGSLRTAESSVRLAARRLSLATLRASDDDRTIDACIGLEALLGDGRSELTHRLALRAATALSTRPSGQIDPAAVYELVRKVYAHRSAVVHGRPADRTRQLTFGDSTLNTAQMAVLLLRDLLADALTRPGGWTTESLDVAVLDALKRQAEDSDDA